MNKQTLFAFAALAWLTAPISAQLSFDLIEINDAPNPLHPGIDYLRHPISFTAVETGGMAVVDFDNDGLIDVFFTDTEGHPNSLYVNQGDGTFSEEAALRGVDEPTKRRGATAFFDLDNDGDLDLLTAGYPSSVVLDFDRFTLFRCNGAPSWNFTDVTASAGGFSLAPTQEGTILGEPGGITVGDYNGDGYLDFFTTYWYRSATFLHDQPRLFRSDPNPTPKQPGQTDYSTRVFFDASIVAGFDSPVQGSYWMPTFHDYDRDGDLDLHLNIEYGEDKLRLNNGDGTFAPDICTSIGMNGVPPEPRNEMGIAFADLDFDGDFESYHTNAGQKDRMYRNDSELGYQGSGLSFTDVAPLNGTAATIIGFGAAFADMDLDGDQDLLAVTAVQVPNPNLYLENQWPELSGDGLTPNFIDKSYLVPDWWKNGPDKDICRGVAMFDFDLDGDLDAIVNRPGLNPALNPGTHPKAGFYLNTYSGTGNNWLQLDLRERNGNRNTIGARVYLQSNGRIHMREIIVGTSFITQEPYRMHFGLGPHDADWIAVRWSSGIHTAVLVPASNQLLTITRPPTDDTGDLNGDGVVDALDVALLEQAILRPKAVDKLYDHWPWEILGDINGDNSLDQLDLDLIQDLVGPTKGVDDKIMLSQQG